MKWCEHRLPTPLRYFRVLARFALIGNPGNDASPLQLPSVLHNPVTDVHVMLRRIECEKRVWSKNVGKKR